MSDAARERARRYVEANTTPMKADEITPCRLCGGKIGHAFWRVKIERGFIDASAARRRMGAELMMGALASVMAPNEPIARLSKAEALIVCDECAFKRGLNEVQAMEVGNGDD